MGRISESLTGFSSLKRRLVMGALTAILAGCVWNCCRWVSKSYDGGAPMQPRVGFESDWAGNSRAAGGATGQADLWATSGIHLGLSFLGAMLAGGLLRTFFRSILTVILVGVITFIFLRDRGVIDPFWDQYFGSVENVKDWATVESISLWETLKDVVPSTGAALVGLGFGLKR